jgi:signal transduction histidine kinase
VPPFAVAVAIVAAVADPSSSAAEVLIAALPPLALTVWAWKPAVPLAALCVAVIVPVVVAQRSGALEPIMFEVSLLAFVIGRWSPSRVTAWTLGLVAVACPVIVGVVQDPSEVSVGVWIVGIAFPWIIARAVARQIELAAQLDATRRELAQQTLLEERRRIARDVHDFVGHGLAGMMLQVTSARHVLRRDPAAAEEALQSAEAVGRASMRELRRTVELLRAEGEAGATAPLPSALEIPALVDQARDGGLAVELRLRGDLARVAPNVGVALYRIAQEALANAARHAPHARTTLGVAVVDGGVTLVAETTGPLLGRVENDEPERARYGVVGMRERSAALGGELTAGPTPTGWRVDCRLPVEAPEP